VLVTFDDAAAWGLLDHVQMQQELATVLGRPVDLITRRAIEQSANATRRESILSTAQVIYRITGTESNAITLFTKPRDNAAHQNAKCTYFGASWIGIAADVSGKRLSLSDRLFATPT